MLDLKSKGSQRNIALFITLLIIGLFLVFGPFKLFPTGAVFVGIDDLDTTINTLDDEEEEFTMIVKLIPGELLPILDFKLVFTNGENVVTCTIDTDRSDDCSFLFIDEIDYFDLTRVYGQGYAYSYGYSETGTFGYGYGYVPIFLSSGTIELDLIITPSKLPSQFFNDEKTSLVASVRAGSPTNERTFSSSTRKISLYSSSEESKGLDDDEENIVTEGSVSMIIPEGTWDDGSSVSIEQISEDAPLAFGTFEFAGKKYAFTTTSESFNGSITISITLTSEEIALMGLDKDTDEFRVFFYDGEAWIDLGGVWDPETLTLTFTVDHFTSFGIAGGQPPTPPSDVSGGGGSGGSGGSTRQIISPCSSSQCNPAEDKQCEDDIVKRCEAVKIDGFTCYEWVNEEDCSNTRCVKQWLMHAYCATCLSDRDCKEEEICDKGRCKTEPEKRIIVREPLPLPPAEEEPAPVFVKSAREPAPEPAPEPEKGWSPLAWIIGIAGLIGLSALGVFIYKKVKKPEF